MASSPYFFNLENAIDKLVPEGGFFVQIGANDGITADPIHTQVKTKHLQGLLVEPLPDIMQKLQKNYQGTPGLQFAECAVTEESGSKTMLRFQPDYAEQVWGGSLVPQMADSPTLSDRALSNRRNGGREHIIEQEVQGKTLPELLRDHQVQKIDLLQIDVEGYDWRVLKQLDFAKFRPNVIHIEYAHLPFEQQQEMRDRLEENGYVFALNNGRDLMAVPAERLCELSTDKNAFQHYQKYVDNGTFRNRQDMIYAVALLHQTLGSLTATMPTRNNSSDIENNMMPMIRDTGGRRDPNWVHVIDGLERLRKLCTNQQSFCVFLQQEMPRVSMTGQNADVSMN